MPLSDVNVQLVSLASILQLGPHTCFCAIMSITVVLSMTSSALHEYLLSFGLVRSRVDGVGAFEFVDSLCLRHPAACNAIVRFFRVAASLANSL